MIARLVLAFAAVGAGVAAVASHSSTPAPQATRSVAGSPARVPARCSTPAAQLLGQRIMVGFDGTSPPAALLARVRRGEVGSVILFGPNIVSRTQLRALTGALQSAAHAGGNPPLLIATDQEGGQVKRLSAGPPSLSPPQMTASGDPGEAFRQGRETGRYLRSLGINWDLAPVLDVPTFSGAFIWRQGRAFSFSAARTATFGTQFARGLQQGGAAATGKHFPGVGSAAVDTDNRLDELRPTTVQRAAALTPYRKAIAAGLDSVMLSTAGFPAYDPSGAPAALSPAIGQLLRHRLGFTGVTISDALGTPTGHDERTAGLLAARAGTDVLLYTDGAPGVLGGLQAELHAGRLSCGAAAASLKRILALKRRVAS